MANNRLLIGNKETLEYLYIAKTYNGQWKDVEVKLLLWFLEWIAFNTDAELFYEYDDKYDVYIKDGEDVEFMYNEYRKKGIFYKLKQLFK